MFLYASTFCNLVSDYISPCLNLVQVSHSEQKFLGGIQDPGCQYLRRWSNISRRNTLPDKNIVSYYLLIVLHLKELKYRYLR